MVHWTLTLFDRQHGWLTPELHHQFRELMFHTCAREGLVCPTYSLMPDHLHLVWMGLRQDTDQLNGMAFLRTYLEPALMPAKTFWKIYAKLRLPDAGNIKRPKV